MHITSTSIFVLFNYSIEYDNASKAYDVENELVQPKNTNVQQMLVVKLLFVQL